MGGAILESALSPYFGQGLALGLGLDNCTVQKLKKYLFVTYTIYPVLIGIEII